MVARSPARRVASAVAHRVTILLFIAFAVFPFYWMVVTSFKQNADLYVGATDTTHNPFIFNRAPTLDHLRTLFGQTLYLTWLTNTLVVGAVVVAITLALAVPAGYSLARLTGRWGERLSIGIFLTYLIPSTLLFIPFSRLVSLLGLQNSHWALILIYPTFTVPFCTWLLMGFFKSLPKEIEESAMVDGCSRAGAIGRIVLPLAVPGLLTVVIFALTLVIQEFVYSLTFISSVEKMTVSVGVPVALVRGDVYYWGSLMAACLITSVPIAIVYNFFLDRFIAGFTVGAIK
jgi:multiple sugar transport system permease protein